MYLLQIVSEIANFFNDLFQLCLNSKSEDLYEFEKNLSSKLLKLGRKLLALKICSLSQNLHHNQNTNLKKHGSKTFTLYSIFGKIKIERDYFWQKGISGYFPLDETLNLPKRIYSYYLQELIVYFSSQSTLKETSQNIYKLFGFEISTKSISDIVKDVSSHAEKFRDIQPPPSKEQELLVVCTDGKGVPMKKEEIASKKTRLKKGEKSQKKKMATVGVIYSIDKEVRNADEILKKENKKHCRPVGKRIRGKIGDKEFVFKKLRNEADLREDENKIKIFLSDGEKALWKLKEVYFSKYIGILDIYHAMEKLWKCGYCFHKEGSEEAKKYVGRKLKLLLNGKVNKCIKEMKEESQKKGLSRGKRKVLESVAKYYRNNRSSMGYNEYLSKGFPIGSGNVESACKVLIKQRMEGSGMRWTKDGGQSMIDIRSIYLNGDLNEFFKCYVEEQREILYGKKEGKTSEGKILKVAG